MADQPYKITNIQRAEHGECALHKWTMDLDDPRGIGEFSECCPDEHQGQLARMLADVYHFARLHGLHWDDAITEARRLHGVESMKNADLVRQTDAA